LIKKLRFEGMSEEIDTRPPMASQKLLGNLTHNNWLSCHAWIFFSLLASRQWL